MIRVAAATAASVGSHRATTHRTVRDIKHGNNGNLIVLHRTDQTTADGIYNLWFGHGG